MRLADRLTGPFILSTSGGILLVAAGIERSVRYFGSTILTPSAWSSFRDVPVSFVLEVSGIIVLLCGIMMFTRPDLREVWGALTVIASSFSLFSASGVSTPSFGAGVVLSLIGGVLGIVLKPELKSKETLQVQAGLAAP